MSDQPAKLEPCIGADGIFHADRWGRAAKPGKDSREAIYLGRCCDWLAKCLNVTSQATSSSATERKIIRQQLDWIRARESCCASMFKAAEEGQLDPGYKPPADLASRPAAKAALATLKSYQFIVGLAMTNVTNPATDPLNKAVLLQDWSRLPTAEDAQRNRTIADLYDAEIEGRSPTPAAATPATPNTYTPPATPPAARETIMATKPVLPAVENFDQLLNSKPTKDEAIAEWESGAIDRASFVSKDVFIRSRTAMTRRQWAGINSRRRGSDTAPSQSGSRRSAPGAATGQSVEQIVATAASDWDSGMINKSEWLDRRVFLGYTRAIANPRR